MHEGDRVVAEAARGPGTPRRAGRLVHAALDLTTDDGQPRRLAELLRDGRPALVDLTGEPGLAATAQPWTDRVRHLRATAGGAPAPALLIRPDGYLAWAGADPGSLEAALARWSG